MLDAFQRGRIWQAFLISKTYASAARLVGVDCRTVKRVVDDCQKNKFVGARRGRVLSRVDLRRKKLIKLAKMTSKKAHRTFPKFATSLALRSALNNETGSTVSARQVRRDLRAVGMRCYVRPKCPTRVAKERGVRRAFAAKMTQWARKDICRICWTDEHWLTCCEATSRMQWAGKKGDVVPREAKARWNVPSVMVWGGAGYNYKTPLIFFPAKRLKDGQLVPFRLDAESYVRRCLSPVVDDLMKHGRVFQQDGARSHVASRTMRYLSRKGVEVLHGWPPYSPDLSVVELLWKELNHRVGLRCPMNVEELQQVAKEEWEKIPMDVINRMALRFQRQMREMK